MHQWLTVPTPDLGEGFKGLMVPPRHDDHLFNALLTEVGTECRDMAAAMAVARATTRAAVQAGVADVHALDADLDDLVRRYYTPDIGGNPEG